MKPDYYYDPYDRHIRYYDLMAKVMLFPFGGENRFRRKALSVLDIESGSRILELGCGTGSMTRAMLDMGADVTAVDLSEPMISKAERRAPGATFVRGDILAYQGNGSFDAALLAFVMHEMTHDIRVRALSTAREACREGGTVCVIDFHKSARAAMRRGLRLYLKMAEPSTAIDWLDHGFEDTLAEAGLSIVHDKKLSGGTARAVAAVAS